ncbi:MAG TPA: hypothetical protein VI039_13165 [Solirubrobacterales bacterium]
MGTCPSCGGVLGRDCFNPEECATISACTASQALEVFGELRAECRQLDQQVEALLGRIDDLRGYCRARPDDVLDCLYAAADQVRKERGT